ncbi:MAG: arginase [candidate division Zixibacteria bacterium]|nr:arginase [candidate division Zixibacteria bacterium]
MTDLKSIDIFEATRRPGQYLFYSHDDPNDPRLGEYVQHDPDNYAEADLVILGCPQDIGVKRNKGRPGAEKAPAEIRQALYRFPLPAELHGRRLFDLGDCVTECSLENIHHNLLEIVRKVLSDSKRIVILGGGNDISYPDCRALAESYDDILAFNIDSHYDVRESERPNSGTPYRQLLEQKYINPENFIELGNKEIVNSPQYRQFLRDLGVRNYPLKEVRKEGIEKLMSGILADHEAEAIFWGFDLDVVRSMDAPGVSASYPVGLTAEEVCEMARVAGSDKRSRILEITEVNPETDINGRTSKLAAMVILNYLVPLLG